MTGGPRIPELLDGRRVCICAGTGGVGKTTTAAAIALAMAAHGLKVVVVTIDPARRLADALGLAELSNDPSPVSAQRFPDLELRGELWALMLDPKRTFDDLIDRVAPSPARAAEIKRNAIYRQMSTAVAGSQEFTAIEKLYELAQEDYDLIVLDTPPAHDATEFLTAPGRLSAFLTGGALQAFLRPTGLGMRLLGMGAAPLLGALRVVTGIDLVSDLTAFFALLGGMTDEFNLRAERVQELLHAPETAVVLLASAQTASATAAIAYGTRLADFGLIPAALVVNRVNEPLPWGAVPLDRAPDLPATLLAKLEDAAAEQELLARRDAANLERLRAAFATRPLLAVPEGRAEHGELDALRWVHDHIC